MLIIKGGKSCLVFTFTYCSSCLKSCKKSIRKSIKFLDFSSIKHIYKSLKNFLYQRLQDERFFIRNHLQKKRKFNGMFEQRIKVFFWQIILLLLYVRKCWIHVYDRKYFIKTFPFFILSLQGKHVHLNLFNEFTN